MSGQERLVVSKAALLCVPQQERQAELGQVSVSVLVSQSVGCSRRCRLVRHRLYHQCFRHLSRRHLNCRYRLIR